MNGKIERGAKKDFVLDLLKKGHKVSQLNLREHANRAGDARLYSTRLGGIVHNLREEHVIETEMVPNPGSEGEHAVYRYIREKMPSEVAASSAPTLNVNEDVLFAGYKLFDRTFLALEKFVRGDANSAQVLAEVDKALSAYVAEKHKCRVKIEEPINTAPVTADPRKVDSRTGWVVKPEEKPNAAELCQHVGGSTEIEKKKGGFLGGLFGF